MTPIQILALFIVASISVLLIGIYIRTWRKATLPKEPPPPKAETPKPPPKYRHGPPYPPEPPYPPKSTLQPLQKHKLPKSFTNRPGVKQARVNLRKTGFKEDAKIEEDPPRRRRH